MSQLSHRRISRRSFLQAAGGIVGAVAWSRRAMARRLLLIATSPRVSIAQIEWIVYDTGLRDVSNQPMHRCAVRLTTADGAQGFADFEGWTAPDSQTAELIKTTVFGQDLANHHDIWTELYQQGVSLEAIAAVDVALWDLRAKIEGRSVSALLGAKRQRVRAYVSSGWNLLEPSAYADFALAAQARGAHGVKIQADTGSPEQDIAAYAAVREAVGPDFICIAGAAAAYTYEQALQVGRRLDELGYAWFQSPLPENDVWVGQYAALADELQTPVCAPETDPGSYASRLTWLQRGACDIPRFDVYHGGLTACLELASFCQGEGVPLDLTDIGADGYAHLQVAGATDETVLGYIETASLLNEPTTLPGRITPEPILDEQGDIAVPQIHGMGLELDWTYISNHRIG